MVGALRRQRERDLIGPDPVEAQIAHSRGFALALGAAEPERVVDLGSGGGLPGLVLAVVSWPEAEVVLLDASQRRCTYLELVVGELGLAPRVLVQWGRAEEMGREPRWRRWADVVVARSFGPPAAVAECAAPLLGPDGRLVVSEPPPNHRGGVRWPGEGLARLGLRPEGGSRAADGGGGYVVLRQVEPCPEKFPRRAGLPHRRPLF